jgi:hypothetical protein
MSHDCIFREIDTKTLYDILAPIHSVVTRAQVNACRLELFNVYRCFILELRMSEATVKESFGRYLSKSAAVLQKRYGNIAQPTLLSDTIVASSSSSIFSIAIWTHG